MNPFRRLVLGTALAAFGMTLAGTAAAQAYPAQQIRMIVPFAPGGAVDQVGRLIAPALAKRLGQSVVVENRPGASGSVGAGELARARPDGYTLMVALDSQAVNHHMVKNLPFDTFKSFDYLTLLVTLPQVLVVRNALPASTLPELVAYLKAHPGTAYGSAGTGSAGHINTAALSIAYNVVTTHAPYKGAGPMLTDLLGGHIDFAFAGLSVMLPQIRAGKVRAIAVSAAHRNPQLPDVPTVAEFVPGFEIPTWIGLVAPAGLPPDVRGKVLAAVRDAMSQPEVRTPLGESTFQIVNGTPEEFMARIHKDSDVMADLVRRKIVTSE